MMHYQRAAGEKTGPFPAGHGETGYIIRRFLALAHLKVLFPYLAAALLLVVVAVGGGRELRHHIHAIETWIMILGPWGLLAFIGLFILTTSFFVPDTVLCLIAGSLFGLGRGVILVTSSCGREYSAGFLPDRHWPPFSKTSFSTNSVCSSSCA